MSLNIGSNIISPIQRNNVINNQSNKNVIPSKNQQVITPASEPVNVTIPGTSGRTFPSGPIEVSIDASFLIYGETYQVVADKIYYHANYRSSTISSISINTQWVAGEDEEIPFSIVNIGSNDGRPTKVTLSKNKIRIYVTSVYGGDMGANGNNGTISFTYLKTYDGLGQVTVEPISSDYTIPEGTLSVLNAGTFDAKSYANVSVPGMATTTWTAASITNSTGKINYSINLPSGFKSTSQSFSSSITLPSVIGTTIIPSNTSQIAVDAYRWTKGSIIVDTIPSTVGVYKKIIEKTITCSELNTFLSSQTTIPSFAFFLTSTLNGTIEASTITEIGSSAFHNCYNISSINFANVTSIGYYAFDYCYSLTNVSLPKLEYAAGSTFSYCSNLSTITLPKLKKLAGYNFYGCLNLVSAYFPEVTSINGYQNFGTCQKLITISLPKVTYIYGYQFQNCIALSTISFPLLETFSYPDAMFAYCKNLKSIYLMSTSVIFLSHSAIFNSCPITISSYLSGEYASIYVPSSLVNDYKTHSIWSWFADRFVGV